MAIDYLSITELHAKCRCGELSPVDVTEAALARMERCDAAINAFVTVTPEIARAAARVAEAKLKDEQSALPRLFGVPVGLKDLSDSVKGVRNTYGSKALADSSRRSAAHHGPTGADVRVLGASADFERQMPWSASYERLQ